MANAWGEAGMCGGTLNSKAQETGLYYEEENRSLLGRLRTMSIMRRIRYPASVSFRDWGSSCYKAGVARSYTTRISPSEIKYFPPGRGTIWKRRYVKTNRQGRSHLLIPLYSHRRDGNCSMFERRSSGTIKENAGSLHFIYVYS